MEVYVHVHVHVHVHIIVGDQNTIGFGLQHVRLIHFEDFRTILCNFVDEFPSVNKEKKQNQTITHCRNCSLLIIVILLLDIFYSHVSTKYTTEKQDLYICL